MSDASPPGSDLGARYDESLAAYISAGDRDGALATAFSLGREAIDAGLGILDLCVIHAAAVGPILTASAPERLAHTSGCASEFFAESLAPFEMVHRGVRDTTKGLQRSVEELRQLAAIVEAADDAIYTVSPENTILSWNAAAERLYGYSVEEAVGQNDDLLVPSTHENERGVLVEQMRRNESLTEFETVRTRKDGSSVELCLTVSPIAADDGGIVAAAVIARDMTERRQAEAAQERLGDQLRQAQKMEAVGNLAGGIAHDFNNLLTVIKGYNALLLTRLDDEELSRDAMIVADAADRAGELTRQLLAFSRQQVLRPEQTSINDVVEQTLQLLDRVIGEDITVDYEPTPDLEPILIDRGQLGQVILNLAINARDAMPEGGSLAVKTANVEFDSAYAAEHVDVVEGRQVLVQMTDTGTGMDDETRDRVFDPFFTTKDEGTGLGLATVYGIVKQSGGHIWLDTELGVGTTLKIYFPSSTEPAVVTPSRAAKPRSLDGTEAILLVEDDHAVRRLVARTLAHHGYVVVEASTPAEALRITEDPTYFDLLLTDVVMPGMNGRELAETILADRPTLKVLFTSGYPADTIIRHGIADGSAAYIGKPYLPAELAHKVREVLDA
jgi:two-component system, cell cycle sensor histidine kinase and response regulator CckA